MVVTIVIVVSVPGPAGSLHEVILEAAGGVVVVVVDVVDVTVVVEYDY